MLASYGSESLQRIRSGELDEHAMQKLRMVAGDMREWPLYLDDSSFLTINQLRGKARRMKDRHNIEMLVIDYLQLLRSESAQAKDNRQNEVAEISRGIKALAKELEHSDHHPRAVESPLGGSGQGPAANRRCTTCANRAPSSRTPTWCYFCIVPILRRMKMATSGRWAPSFPTNLIIAKQRNGPTDKLDILFHAPYTRFDDPVRHETRARN